MMKVWKVEWRTREGKLKTDYFVPVCLGYMTLSYLHVCANGRQAQNALDFAKQVSWSEYVKVSEVDWQPRSTITC